MPTAVLVAAYGQGGPGVSVEGYQSTTDQRSRRERAASRVRWLTSEIEGFVEVLGDRRLEYLFVQTHHPLTVRYSIYTVCCILPGEGGVCTCSCRSHVRRPLASSLAHLGKGWRVALM